MTEKKLSPAQQKVVNILKANPSAYVYSTEFWDFQQIQFPLSTGKLDWEKTVYFKKRTREVLVAYGILKEYEPRKFALAIEK